MKLSTNPHLMSISRMSGDFYSPLMSSCFRQANSTFLIHSCISIYYYFGAGFDKYAYPRVTDK